MQQLFTEGYLRRFIVVRVTLFLLTLHLCQSLKSSELARKIFAFSSWAKFFLLSHQKIGLLEFKWRPGMVAKISFQKSQAEPCLREPWRTQWRKLLPSPGLSVKVQPWYIQLNEGQQGKTQWKSQVRMRWGLRLLHSSELGSRTPLASLSAWCLGQDSLTKRCRANPDNTPYPCCISYNLASYDVDNKLYHAHIPLFCSF